MRPTPVTFFASSASTVAISRSSSSRDADPADDVVEEAVHDQAARLVLGDPARLQVEQLLVVEAAGGRRVAGALDLAGLDLEVRHRVGAAPVGEHEVAVLLVGLDALGDLADQHVADPDRVRALALQRALVDDVAAGVRGVVVGEEPVLEVLAGVGEVEPEQLGRAAGPAVVDVARPSARRRRRRRSPRACTSRRGRRSPRGGSGGRRRRPSPAGTRRDTSAPSPTWTSTTCASVAEPVWLSTTTALRVGAEPQHHVARPRRARRPVPLTSTRIGSATSVSAGTSTSSVLGASASTRAANRVFGTRPETPRSAWLSSPSTELGPHARRGCSTGDSRRR